MTEDKRKVFTNAFANLVPGKIEWHSAGRRTAQQTRISADLIPEGGIVDEFVYKKHVCPIVMSFSQRYYYSQPICAQYFLNFVFGPVKNPKNPFGGTKGFEYLSSAKMCFSLGLHGGSLDDVDLWEQNMGIRQDGGFGRPDGFTETGVVLMEDFMVNKDNFLVGNGLKEPDMKTLSEFLEKVENAYKSGNLHPDAWCYT